MTARSLARTLRSVHEAGSSPRAGANGVETHDEDGSVDSSYTAHYNDAGVAVTTHKDPGGEPVPTRYSLLLENVSDDTIETYERFSGQKLAHNAGNVRVDFTPEDFKAIQGQAWDQLVHEQEMWRTGVDEATLHKVMAEYPHGGDPYGVDRPMSPRTRSPQRRRPRRSSTSSTSVRVPAATATRA
jgi:hypothetical protein